MGSNLGPLQLVHWQSDALTTKLNLIRSKLDLIRLLLQAVPSEKWFYKLLFLVFATHFLCAKKVSKNLVEFEWKHQDACWYVTNVWFGNEDVCFL